MAFIEVLNSKGKRVDLDIISNKLATEKTRNARSRVRIISKKDYDSGIKVIIKNFEEKKSKLDPKSDSKGIKDIEKRIDILKNQGKSKKSDPVTPTNK